MAIVKCPLCEKVIHRDMRSKTSLKSFCETFGKKVTLQIVRKRK